MTETSNQRAPTPRAVLTRARHESPHGANQVLQARNRLAEPLSFGVVEVLCYRVLPSLLQQRDDIDPRRRSLLLVVLGLDLVAQLGELASAGATAVVLSQDLVEARPHVVSGSRGDLKVATTGDAGWEQNGLDLESNEGLA